MKFDEIDDKPEDNISVESIFETRARELAKTHERETKLQGSAFLVFCLGSKGDEKYAISYQHVVRVVPLQGLTKVPGVPKLLMGITYHNAQIWPVIDTEVLFQFDCAGTLTPEYIILIRKGTGHYALSVRYIVGHMQLDTQSLSKLTGEKHAGKAYTRGVYQPNIVIVDDTAIFKMLNEMNLT